MEGAAGRQDPDPAGAASGELDRRLDRFRPAVGEDDVREARRSQCQQSFGQLALRRGNRCDHEIRHRLAPDGLQRLPYRRRIVAERNGAELSDAVGVADAVGVEQVAPFAPHECLVETEPLIQEALVRRDVSNIGILLLRAPVLHRSKRDDLAVEKGSAAVAGGAVRRYVVLGRSWLRWRAAAAIA